MQWVTDVRCCRCNPDGCASRLYKRGVALQAEATVGLTRHVNVVSAQIVALHGNRDVNVHGHVPSELPVHLCGCAPTEHPPRGQACKRAGSASVNQCTLATLRVRSLHMGLRQGRGAVMPTRGGTADLVLVVYLGASVVNNLAPLHRASTNHKVLRCKITVS